MLFISSKRLCKRERIRGGIASASGVSFEFWPPIREDNNGEWPQTVGRREVEDNWIWKKNESKGEYERDGSKAVN